jgi:hypothetical protein
MVVNGTQAGLDGVPVVRWPQYRVYDMIWTLTSPPWLENRVTVAVWEWRGATWTPDRGRTST